MKMLVIIAISLPMLAAVHPTKAQLAYFNEHDKCVAALRTAKKAANDAPSDQKKKLLSEAKATYRKCEDHAHLVWKYYPLPPPEPKAQP
jgi:hypothetical protein